MHEPEDTNLHRKEGGRTPIVVCLKSFRFSNSAKHRYLAAAKALHVVVFSANMQSPTPLSFKIFTPLGENYVLVGGRSQPQSITLGWGGGSRLHVENCFIICSTWFAKVANV